MGKVIERTLVSLDGIIGDPHVWALPYFDKAAQDDALAELMASDAMLMGRRTYAIFAKLWPSRTGAYFDRINAMKKYVFSSDLRNADWRNTSIIRGDVVDEVAKLKRESAKDLVIYGHTSIAQVLLAHGLLDEIQLAVHPVLVGTGKLLFREGERAALDLMEVKPRPNGVVALRYRVATKAIKDAERLTMISA